MGYRCRKCSGDSVINMRQHRLALCEDHFIEWVQKHAAEFIRKHRMLEPEDRVLVAVSGGKDSLSLWSILLDLGYQADGIYIDLGIDRDRDESGYSKRSLQYAVEFAQSVSPRAKLHVLDIKAVYGRSVTEIARGGMGAKRKYCSACGLVKRHELNRMTRELGYAVLATGHNLDDEAAVLMGNSLNWEVEYMARQALVLPASSTGLVKKVKPLARFYEREMAAYAIVRGIPYIMEECPFSEGATSLGYKEVLNSMERKSSGTKLKFYFEFLKAKKKGLLPNYVPPELRLCEKCGEPTGSTGLCAFCRLIERPARPVGVDTLE